METFRLNVNGKDHSIAAEPTSSLLSVLRNDLHLTGAKPGCGEGECGACTVLLGGRAIRSCITPVSEAAAQPVTTIEGLAGDAKLQRIQQAFLKHSAFQCGYCTPGMIMASVALLQKLPNPTTDQIRQELNGNICRCGTYLRIVRAVQQAAKGEEHA